jgi:hypothetical protein
VLAQITNLARSLGQEGEGIQLVPMGSAGSDGAVKPKNKGVVKALSERGRAVSKVVSMKEIKKNQKADFKKKQEIQKEKQKKQAQSDADETDKLIGSVKEYIGMGEDPPNSKWIKLMRKNEEGEVEEVGGEERASERSEHEGDASMKEKTLGAAQGLPHLAERARRP